MEIHPEPTLGSSTARPHGAPRSCPIAHGDGWAVSEFVCTLGPHDPRFEEQHDIVAISAVVEGSFYYRTTTGDALLYPGSFLLGNAGACYECGHEHGSGDRCLAFHYAPWFFEEIAATAGGSARFRFPVAMLPAMRQLTRPMLQAEATLRGASHMAVDELTVQVAEAVIATASGAAPSTAAPTPKEQRRIGEVLRHIEAHAEEPLDLAGLATRAFMSKYHFLRTFRRVVGVTPYQFLLRVRLRRAALRLCMTSLPVADIALDTGFGDLSTFNSHFRQLFGLSPGAFRRRPV